MVPPCTSGSVSLSISLYLKKQQVFKLHADDVAGNICHQTLPNALHRTRSSRSTRRERSPPGTGASLC